MSESEPESEGDESDKRLRQQLTDAMETIRDQIARLREGPDMGGPLDDRSVIADLEAEYAELKQARERLG